MERENILNSDHNICLHVDSESFAGAIIPPIYGNSLFTFNSYEDYVLGETNQQNKCVYWRGTNPTVEIAEKKLAALERGDTCKCFASGMAAITAAIFNSVKSGDHVLSVGNIYQSTDELLNYLQKFGVEHSTVFSVHIDDIRNAIRPNTSLIYIECPTDMNLQLVPLKKLASLAKDNGIRTIVDNTWATPLFQKPLIYGIDIVVHSASKYLGGHSDLVGGAIITSTEIMKTLFKKEYLLFGSSMGPYEASLLLRGLQTLPIRMKALQDSTMKIAQFLDKHPAIKRVHYPGLGQKQFSNETKHQLTGFSSLLTFELKKADHNAVISVINKVKVFKIGVSWGGLESLIITPNLGHNEEELKKKNINPYIIRLSIGMEPSEDLINDLRNALGQ
ncbi:trans-sulfuration enzyme family protein [Metabacillus sp. 22489]|uniref:trans-sulfuration enzyme family protein n=1 Tax=Metabacillus sp. 22489 TaxID=3453928 RepID=UPI003F8562EE